MDTSNTDGRIAENDIIESTEAFVMKLFKEQLPAEFSYHDTDHTRMVVDAAEEIGAASGLNDEQLEIVVLAAWLHDTGYTQAYEGHEQKSVEIARRFLGEQGYPEQKIEAVAGCIAATHYPQQPNNLLEEVVCDADMVHLGHTGYGEKVSSLRDEWQMLLDRRYSDPEWLRRNIAFIQNHTFHTAYANARYGDQLETNLKRLREQYGSDTESGGTAPVGAAAELAGAQSGVDQKLKQRLDGVEERIAEEVVEQWQEKKKEKKEKKKKKKKSKKNDDEGGRSKRGVETVFRIASRNHIDLSSMADNKANIMISVNAIIISIIVSVLVRNLNEAPNLVIPTVILLVVCVTTIIFATLATRPKVTEGTFTESDITDQRTNLLFFGNFYNVDLKLYEDAMQKMLDNSNYLYSTLIRDLYYLGQVLGKKYRYLRICYNVFMYGLIVAVLVYVLAYVSPESMP